MVGRRSSPVNDILIGDFLDNTSCNSKLIKMYSCILPLDSAVGTAQENGFMNTVVGRMRFEQHVTPQLSH